MSRVAFIHNALGKTDGVSLEVDKWRVVLERMGHEVFYCAGNDDVEGVFCIPELSFNHPVTYKILRNATVKLTDYNSYYYTLYTRWLSDVENICDTLNELNIYSCRLAKHERLDENVYKVTYMNDTTATKIEIVLNYQRINWTYENGVVIPAKSYKIV